MGKDSVTVAFIRTLLPNLTLSDLAELDAALREVEGELQNDIKKEKKVKIQGFIRELDKRGVLKTLKNEIHKTVKVVFSLKVGITWGDFDFMSYEDDVAGIEPMLNYDSQEVSKAIEASCKVEAEKAVKKFADAGNQLREISIKHGVDLGDRDVYDALYPLIFG